MSEISGSLPPSRTSTASNSCSSDLTTSLSSHLFILLSFSSIPAQVPQLITLGDEPAEIDQAILLLTKTWNSMVCFHTYVQASYSIVRDYGINCYQCLRRMTERRRWKTHFIHSSSAFCSKPICSSSLTKHEYMSNVNFALMWVLVEWTPSE